MMVARAAIKVKEPHARISTFLAVSSYCHAVPEVPLFRRYNARALCLFLKDHRTCPVFRAAATLYILTAMLLLLSAPGWAFPRQSIPAQPQGSFFRCESL